jgi:uncharacterized membrane protein
MTRAAVVLGIGIGGFFDGIVFHQLLQWHHVLSARVPPDTLTSLELNTLADGVFHGSAWVVTLVGLWLLVRARASESRVPGTSVLGGMLAGWGGFNLVEGLADHYVLAIHHVRAGPDQALYDAAFLAWGAIFLALGGLTLRRRSLPQRT